MRLACLIHAASVRSEPESNSPYYYIRNCWTDESSLSSVPYPPLRSFFSFRSILARGYGTRHDLFLPSLLPLRRSSRKVLSLRCGCLRCRFAPQKVCFCQFASPGLRRHPLHRSRLTVPGGLPTGALSGCPVRGCRRIYSPHPATSSLFYEFFSQFFARYFLAN